MKFLKIIKYQSLILAFVFFPILVSSKESTKYELAICAIFQNDANYLREWIEFHKIVGVEHFYLYNHLSTDDCHKVLKPYINSGEVELIEWKHRVNPDGSNWPSIQMSAYNHAINLSKNRVKWLAIIDTDEFLFPVNSYTLTEFLLDYEDVAALCVNWQMYGTSNIKSILPGHLLIEDLIYKAPTQYNENMMVKSIVRPNLVKNVANPHCTTLLPEFLQVDADKEPFNGPRNTIKIDKIRINHYWTRDEDFFNSEKVARRQRRKDGAVFKRAANINKEIDTAIYKYVPKLKENMNLSN